MGRRLLTPEESERLIAKYRPQRTNFKWKKSRKWWCNSYAMTAHEHGCFEVGCIYPDTHFLAIVFLHECAHVVDRQILLETDQTPAHVYEYAAERTAMRWWQNEGYAVPPEYLRIAKAYIRKKIRQDRRKGIKIKPHIARWARTGVLYAKELKLRRYV